VLVIFTGIWTDCPAVSAVLALVGNEAETLTVL
jgi:hypothetical protein